MSAIKKKVEAGMPYMGSGAGSNVAATTIKTTNDMPIVHPESLEALGLVPSRSTRIMRVVNSIIQKKKTIPLPRSLKQKAY